MGGVEWGCCGYWGWCEGKVGLFMFCCSCFCCFKLCCQCCFCFVVSSFVVNVVNDLFLVEVNGEFLKGVADPGRRPFESEEMVSFFFLFFFFSFFFSFSFLFLFCFLFSILFFSFLSFPFSFIFPLPFFLILLFPFPQGSWLWRSRKMGRRPKKDRQSPQFFSF